MQRQLISRLPPFLQEVAEFKVIYELGEQPEYDSLWDNITDVLNDQFIETATINGIERLEKMCGIYPKSEESLEDRKFRLNSVYLEKRPTTLIFLKRQLEILCGKGNYTVSVNNQGYRLTVRLALVSKNSLSAVAELIDKIKPANIISDIDLLYNVINPIFYPTTLHLGYIHMKI